MNCKATLNAITSSASSTSNNPCILTGIRIPYPHSFKSRSGQSHFLRFHPSIHRLDLGHGHVRNPEIRPQKRRRRLTPHACSLELPLLPFPLDQVLVPSESKTLHLYEARYLALLEESFSRKKRLFVHFVLDPIVISSTSFEASFAARYGCLVVIEKVDRLDVGALVSVRGIGRVTVMKFEQVDPFLKGTVIPLQDSILVDVSNLSARVCELKEALYNLNSLEIKLKATHEALLLTRTANSLVWAEKESSLECAEAFIPSFAERVSFAALQPVSGSTQTELLKLQKEKLKAMDVKDTQERVEKSLKFVKNNISMVAAKLAIQSLELQ